VNITVIDKTANKTVFTKAKEALGFFRRLRGLMFRKTMPPEEHYIELVKENPVKQES